MSRKVLIVIAIILVVAIAVAFYMGWLDPIIEKILSAINPETPPTIVSGALSVHFLELGNKYTGDSVYIKAGETDILIDAGSRNNSAETIHNYIKNYVTDGKLEYVIATHGHEDHIAGFYSTSTTKGIFERYDTETIIDFAFVSPDKEANYENRNTNTVVGKYAAARDGEVEKGATWYTAAQCFNETDGAKRTYQLADGIELEILYNYYYFNQRGNSAGENDYSVCVMINQGDNHYIFTGDLESGAEKKIVDYYKEIGDPLPQCKLYKAGHHGSKTSSCAEFMSAIKPEYVVVCCCCGTSEYTDANETQFPTQIFIENVAPYTDKVYVTSIVDNYVDKSDWSKQGTVKSMNGNVVFACTDGKISITCSNNDILLKDTDWFKTHRVTPDAWK